MVGMGEQDYLLDVDRCQFGTVVRHHLWCCIFPTRWISQFDAAKQCTELGTHRHQRGANCTVRVGVVGVATWKLLEKGSAIDIAWSGKGGKDCGAERFGKLERIFDVVDPVKKKKLTLGVLTTKKKKEEETSSKILLKTKEFANPQVAQELLLHTNDDRLTSGLLMGVYTHQDNSSSTGGSSSSQSTNTGSSNLLQEPPIQITGEENESKTFQLYDWWSLQPIGESLPPPLKVYWEPNQNYCIFVYSQYFCLFKIRPTIHMLCRWPFTLTSALWHNNTLFFTTPNDIQCLFPNNHESAPLILSSSSGTVFPEDLYEELAERAFKIATTLEPHSAYQELALHYIHYKKIAELKELQQSIQHLYPLECGLISLLIE
ncbi:hypothetical protein PPL_01806 [Heterostelium album PN500]|uniref:Uncharacterized protein n=1 Tax=Heterostelium pallidum (strain ATCC 26659 / Pp 5 / PN500) TaxID=670386 RepID=D3B0I9_HETP5|nr:hypothetical protein PPL_01806 [Heterostelium album PN500]EFA84813.1 hypothetical protein PPL_01806 [Heterostelium album PN500]|eukprot:XP_020436924.1 hypothetical protein PPL_01806 [Heterostelium album PN500]